MTKIEINTFIEQMAEFGDVWTPEEVKNVYGDRTLEDAIADREAIHIYWRNINDVIINQ